jgi:hypothetical protein
MPIIISLTAHCALDDVELLGHLQCSTAVDDRLRTR